MSAFPATAADGKRLLASVNEVTLLRDVLVREIRALGALYVVGKRRPISELPEDKQVQVRAAYADTGWASDYCVEIQGVFTSLGLADQACKERGTNWFYTKVPIDSVLPDEVVFGEWAHQFPGSDATELYENLRAATVAVPVSQLRVLEEEATRLLQIIKSARNTTENSP
jgi:hypothetical protein